MSRPTLSSLLNAKADLSGEMALRFEKAFGVDMETLMRMQNSYDIAQTRSRAKKIHVGRYEPRKSIAGPGLHSPTSTTARWGAVGCTIEC